MRRNHCEVTDPTEMLRILGSTTIGRMATVDAEGYPYITPLNFVFHDGCVYFHCALQGEKLDNLARHPQVGFEVSVPLAYVEVAFNPDRDPCRTHQLYHSVIIRGRARIVPDGELKTAVLNALVAKHEGHRNFPPVTPDAPLNTACCVVEITPEKMTAKSDLAQNKPAETRRGLAEHLVKRGLPDDLDAVRAMGFELQDSTDNGWHVKD